MSKARSARTSVPQFRKRTISSIGVALAVAGGPPVVRVQIRQPSWIHHVLLVPKLIICRNAGCFFLSNFTAELADSSNCRCHLQKEDAKKKVKQPTFWKKKNTGRRWRVPMALSWESAMQALVQFHFHVSTGISHCHFPRCKVSVMRELRDGNFSKFLPSGQLRHAWHLSSPPKRPEHQAKEHAFHCQISMHASNHCSWSLTTAWSLAPANNLAGFRNQTQSAATEPGLVCVLKISGSASCNSLMVLP